MKKISDNTFSFKKSYIAFSGNSLQIKNKRTAKKENQDAMPSHNFEIQFSFKTSSKNVALFSVDNPSQGGHDRDIILKGGNLYAYVWPGRAAKLSKTNLADGKWHSFSLRCEDGTKCLSTIDGKRGHDGATDHSNFDWASRIVLGSSKMSSQFTGEMRDIVYKSNKMSEADMASSVSSAAAYIMKKKTGNQLTVNEEVNINEMQFATLVY